MAFERAIAAAVLVLGVAAAAAGQGIEVAMATDEPPTIQARGSYVVRTPDVATLGQDLWYPGIDADNLQYRAYLKAPCRVLDQANPAIDAIQWHKEDVAGFYAGPGDVPGDKLDAYHALAPEPVTVVRRPTRTVITAQSFERVGLNQIDCNAGRTAVTCGTQLARTVTNSVTRSAHWDLSATVTQEVNYRIGSSASFAGAGGSTSLSFTGGYGQSTGTTQTVTVGATESASITVPANTSETLELSVVHGSITAEVDYEQAYTGDVVLECDFDVVSVMAGTPAGGNAWRKVPIQSLYDGSLPTWPQQPWVTNSVPIDKLELRETIQIDAYDKARVREVDDP